MAGCMMMTQNMTTTYASANGTTSASRAHSAAMSCTSKSHIALILDAILLASIIICVLICGIGILALAITLLVLVLVLGLLVRNRFDFHTPEMRRRALL